MVSNRSKYEIQDIGKYRKVLIKMIEERMGMLSLMYMQLTESIEDTDICENMLEFNELCRANRIIIHCHYNPLISKMYAENKVLECLRDNVGNGIWPKDINYDLFTNIDNMNVTNCYYQIADEKEGLIKIACEEIEMVKRLIEVNAQKNEKIIEGAGEMDIYALDQACANIDMTVEHIRKIIIKIPTIVERKRIIELKNKYEKDKRLRELYRKTKEEGERKKEEREKKRDKKRREKKKMIGLIFYYR